MKISKKIISLFLSILMMTSTIGSIDLVSDAAEVPNSIAISTKKDFYNIRNNPNGNYYLTDDIVFDRYDFISHGEYYNNGKNFISMGMFNGVFDGCGHTITGLIGDNGIAVQNNGTIKNVVIDDSYLTDAAICKVNYGVVENCKLSNSSATNGIVTNNGSKGTIHYCFSETSNTGICNFNAGTIDSCINNSDITEDGFYYFYYASIAAVGGITCVNIGSIKNCINNGNISSNLSDNRTAGIAGTSEINDEYGTVENCTNTGNISGTLNASGITNNGGFIYDSINTGSINMLSNKDNGTGIFGNGGHAINCVNIGLVDNGKGCPITENGYVTDCYILENSATQRCDEGILLSADEMNKEESFPILDFRNTWQITENGISLQCTNKKQIGTAVYQYPSRTYYNVGEKLNLSNMFVMTFDNHGEWQITDDYTVSGFTGKLGKNIIKVTAGGFSSSFNVYVRDHISKSKITLSAGKFTATGKAIKPTVKVIAGSGKVLKLNTDYTLSYAANTNPGIATVTITGKGLYTGSVKKSFTIVPMQTKGIKVSSRKTNSLKLSWTKQNGVTGYVVEKYDTKGKKWKTYKNITSNTNSITVSKLTQSTTYKFRIRSYKTINSKKYYGSYSSTITTPTSPSKVKAKSATIYWHHNSRKYSIKWNKVKNVSGYQIQIYGYDYNKNKKYWKTIKTVKGAGKTSYTSKWYNDNFDGEKIRIRAYKEVNGKKYYGEWTVSKAKWLSK